MSADNWAICPRCKVACDERNKAKLNAPGLNYGKVSQPEYDKLLKAATELEKPSETLREDYEIGMDKFGKFYVSYGCSCTECNFEFSFKKEELARP